MSEIRTPGRMSLCEEHAPDNDEAGHAQGQAKVKSLQRHHPRTGCSRRRQLPQPPVRPALPGFSPPCLSLLLLWLAPAGAAPRGGATTDERQPDEVAVVFALAAAIAALAAIVSAVPPQAQQTIRHVLQQLEQLRTDLAAALVRAPGAVADGFAPSALVIAASRRIAAVPLMQTMPCFRLQMGAAL